MLAVADNYLRERATDFRDVGHRVLRHLRQEDKKSAFQIASACWGFASDQYCSGVMLEERKNSASR